MNILINGRIYTPDPDLGGVCAGVRTRGGLNSSRFVDGMVISPIN